MDNHFNDIKHKALLYQTGHLTGKLDDLESEYIKNLIVGPAGASQVNDLWDALFDQIGIPSGSFNNRAEDYILNYAGVLPESPDMNGLWLAYWESLQP